MNSETPKTPLTSHPAFKWGVGIWFGLLLGLGLYVMPGEVHDVLARRLGLNQVLADEALRRGVLAGGAALVGLAVGLLLAIRVGAINEAATIDFLDGEDEQEPDAQWLGEAEETEVEPAEVMPQRFLNPREDIGEQGIGAAIYADVEDPAVPDGPDETTGAAFEDLPEDRDWPDADADDDDVDHVEDNTAPAAPEISPKPPAVPEEPYRGNAAPEPQESLPESALADRALGDLSLDELTDRLGLALAAFKNAPSAANQPTRGSELVDEQGASDGAMASRQFDSPDHESELRSALEKLGRINTSR